ncbi:glutamate 5-kinase [Thalassotalea sp. PS06]|uniref:glutamate 5-kinase n=1 Tax=Thalassotalea sp. PS06 TaxID=2594005 RepID=UPI001162097C|nr:glutamate 5-kinase [Thalassotalea sp. PS06]QDP02689.1 glutamate 5-kinase [Thalassotalea sp. PS06]
MQYKRIVVKVGSALVSPDGQGCSGKHVLAIAGFISDCHQKDIEVILVSSGSVAAGRALITHGSNNPSIAAKQAMAAVGQMQMMANWQRFFDFSCSQLLITHGDLKDRKRYLNIKNTVRVLLENRALPIINENDTVATQELKVGDNDNLAALVAMVVEADALLILSDVDGVFDKDPRKFADAILLPNIEKITQDIYDLAGGTSNHLATGGMATKIQAADKACEQGIETFIVNGTKPRVFEQLLNGENPGTHFSAQGNTLTAKKQWLKNTLKSSGAVHVDQGAVRALQETGASLLAIGVKGLTGDFAKGAAVDIIYFDEQAPKIIGKGISQYSSSDLARIQGQGSHNIEAILGYCPSQEVIHRDDLVLSSK